MQTEREDSNTLPELLINNLEGMGNLFLPLFLQVSFIFLAGAAHAVLPGNCRVADTCHEDLPLILA